MLDTGFKMCGRSRYPYALDNESGPCNEVCFAFHYKEVNV